MCLTSLSYTEDNLGEIVDTAGRALSLGQHMWFNSLILFSLVEREWQYLLCKVVGLKLIYVKHMSGTFKNGYLMFFFFWVRFYRLKKPVLSWKDSKTNVQCSIQCNNNFLMLYYVPHVWWLKNRHKGVYISILENMQYIDKKNIIHWQNTDKKTKEKAFLLGWSKVRSM